MLLIVSIYWKKVNINRSLTSGKTENKTFFIRHTLFDKNAIDYTVNINFGGHL